MRSQKNPRRNWNTKRECKRGKTKKNPGQEKGKTKERNKKATCRCLVFSWQSELWKAPYSWLRSPWDNHLDCTTGANTKKNHWFNLIETFKSVFLFRRLMKLTIWATTNSFEWQTLRTYKTNYWLPQTWHNLKYWNPHKAHNLCCEHLHVLVENTHQRHQVLKPFEYWNVAESKKLQEKPFISTIKAPKMIIHHP